ncbi:MAG: hypothetical protein MUP82_03690 [Candidatus Marinimicrobia bacterium]|nr:hypothetical protein [Candidatus Neomarinimicrobiota bacterium]
MQNILAILIGVVAFIYVVKIIINQLSHSEKNPKCENCPVPGIMNKQKKSM